MLYPSREKYFAYRFLRLMAKTCAANDIGCDAFTLLVNVVMIEDAKRYSAPVSFTNEQLMPICGFGSKDRLCRARERAIEQGWLHYQVGRKGYAGRYWVLIPERFVELPDGSTDGLSIRDSDARNPADGAAIPSGIRTESATESRLNPLQKTGEIAIQSGIRTATATESRRNPRRKADGNRATLIPIPNSNPKEKRLRFSPPSLDEVREYCRVRDNAVDPEQFLDYYTANGWVQGKSKPIRDWQATIRTWERNDMQRSGGSVATVVAPKAKPAQPIGYGRRSI